MSPISSPDEPGVTVVAPTHAAAGRLIQADFLKGMRGDWIYTDAGQIDWIKHWSPADGGSGAEKVIGTHAI